MACPAETTLRSRQAFETYKPKYYDGPLLLLRASSEDFGWNTLPTDLGWKDWCNRVSVRFYEGTHDINNPWTGGTLCAEIRDELNNPRSIEAFVEPQCAHTENQHAEHSQR